MQVLLQVVSLFLLMACGLLAVRSRMMDERGVGALNNLVLYFAQPALIACKMQQDFSPSLLRDLLTVFGLTCLVIALSAGIALCIFRRQGPQRRPVLVNLSMASNCGFMGYPVIIAAMGGDALIYAVMYVAAFNLMCWTLGPMLYGAPMRPRELLRNPSLVAVLLGMLLLLTGWRLPAFLNSALDMLGATTTPVAMFVVGAHLAGLRREHLRDLPLFGACCLRLIIFPLAALFLLRLAGTPEIVASSVFLCTAMPCAALTAMQAGLYGSDKALASRGIALSTALSILTVPVLLLLIQAP